MFFLWIAIWVISLLVFYYVIKTAVKHGVTEANHELLESVLAIERKLENKEIRIIQKDDWVITEN